MEGPSNRRQLPYVSQNRQVPASTLNAIIREYNGRNGGINRNNMIGVPGEPRRTITRRFRLKEWTAADYFVCRTLDFDNDNAAVVGSVDIYIAKPYDLRQTPFDGNGFTMNGVALTFSYSSATVRTVTRTSDSATETQHIIPYYYVDLEIVARRGVIGGTGLTDPNGNPIVWEALHDGRHWTEVNS